MHVVYTEPKFCLAYFATRTSSGSGKHSNASSNSDNNNKKDEGEWPPKRSLKLTSSEAIGARCASSKKSLVSSEDVEGIMKQMRNKGCQARKTSFNTSGS